MLNLQICTVIIITKKKKNIKKKQKKKKKKKKNHAILEIRARDTWFQSPPRYPLRYGDQCKLLIKIINIY